MKRSGHGLLHKVILNRKGTRSFLLRRRWEQVAHKGVTGIELIGTIPDFRSATYKMIDDSWGIADSKKSYLLK